MTCFCDKHGEGKHVKASDWTLQVSSTSSLLQKSNSYEDLPSRINIASTLISPMSFTITAIRSPAALVRMWLTSVVFPAAGQKFHHARNVGDRQPNNLPPRNPERTVTGNKRGADMTKQINGEPTESGRKGGGLESVGTKSRTPQFTLNRNASLDVSPT
jgi:hypothetical protein